MALTLNGNTNTIAGVAVGGLPDGIVDTDMLAANAVTVAKATGSVKGITMSELWRINTNFSATTGILTSNWEAMDQTGKGNIGSSMSESSGVFTFPSTGIYYIQFICAYYDSATAQRYLGAQIETTINNSAYTTASINYGSFPSISGATHTTVVTSTIFDVEDTSTHKCKFGIAPVESGGPNIHGSTDQNQTHVLFIRLGDT